jgi:hypothetical protein
MMRRITAQLDSEQREALLHVVDAGLAMVSAGLIASTLKFIFELVA